MFRGTASWVEQVVLLFHKVFPDIQVRLYDLIAEDDKVVTRWGVCGIPIAAY